MGSNLNIYVLLGLSICVYLQNLSKAFVLVIKLINQLIVFLLLFLLLTNWYLDDFVE